MLTLKQTVDLVSLQVEQSQDSYLSVDFRPLLEELCTSV